MRGCEAAVERRSSYATLCSSCAVLCGTYYPGVSGQQRIRRRSYAEHRSLRGTFPWSRPALIPTASWGLPFAATFVCAVFPQIRPGSGCIIKSSNLPVWYASHHAPGVLTERA